jgi:hypothetical protein
MPLNSRTAQRVRRRAETYDFPPMLGPAEDWPEGSPDYALRLGNQLNYTARNPGRLGVGPLVPLVRKAIEVRPWLVWPTPPEGPCGSVDAYFQLCTGYTYNEITAVIVNLSRQPELARQLALANAGTDSATREGDRTDLGEHRIIDTKLSQRGAAYVLRRLARAGRTDLLERFKNGELSANAAAIEAGFRKKPTPLEDLNRAWNRASEAERAAFMEEHRASR